MSKHHCWNILGRIACALFAVTAIASICCAKPTLAAKEHTVQAANTVTKPIVSEGLVVADAVASKEVSEPLNIAKTVADKTATEGKTDAQADTITVSGSFVLPEELANLEEDLIFQIRRKRRLLSPVSIGIQKGATYYIPMLEIARLTGIKADADIANGVVTGFFIKPENIYRIDNKEKTYTAHGKTHDLPEGSVIIRDLGSNLGDIYLPIDLLNEIWPLDLVLNFADLSLNIKTALSLPEELRRERHLKYDLLKEGDEDALRGLNLIPIPNHYRTFTLPALNISNRLQWREEEEVVRNTISVGGQNDLLGTNANYNLSVQLEEDDTPEVRNARLKFTRKDYGNGELPFGLKRVEAGDVAARPSELIEKSVRGRGVIISNSPLRKPQTFDEIAVEGTAQPGWDVEVYNRSRLIDFGVVDERGEYRFENIPLTYGGNEIRVVLYGPQGQIEERVEKHQVGGKMLLPGETSFEAGIVSANRDLIRVDDRRDNQPQGPAYHLKFDRGINEWVSAYGTATTLPTDIGREEYLTLGTNFAALGGTGQAEIYKQRSGGSAFGLRYLGRYAGVKLNLRSSVFRDFESEEAGFGSRAKSFEHEVRANTRMRTLLGSLGLSFNALHRKLEDDTKTTDLRNSVSLAKNALRVTHNLNTDLINGSHNKTKGDLNLNARLGRDWQVRTRLDYDIYPNYEFDRAFLDVRYRGHDKFTGAFNISEDLQTANTRFGANVSYDFDTFLGGLDFAWGEESGANIALRANTSLGPYGPNGSYIARSQNQTGQSRIKGRIFEDNNADNIYNEGDTLIEKAEFSVNRQNSDPTNEHGVALIERGGPEGFSTVLVDPKTLPNSFMASAIDGYSTTMRPGTHTLYADFPIILTGTIDGIVRFANGDPIPGIIIQLLNQDGKMLQETATSYDGFYTFEYVKPETYIVQVSPSHPVNVPPKTVSVTSDDLFAYGVDLQVMEQADEVSAAEETRASGRVAQLHHAPVAEGTLRPAPYPSDGGFQTIVRAVRIGEHPYKVRLVLDLSAPTDYAISSESGGQVINIDLPSTAWDASRYHDLSKHPIFKDCEVLALNSGTGTRLRLTGRKAVEIFYNAQIPPESNKPQRIYIDFIKKK